MFKLAGRSWRNAHWRSAGELEIWSGAPQMFRRNNVLKNKMPKTKVLEVVDGDTIRGQGKVFIRLAGVDAPETGTKGAAAAKEFLDNLVTGKTVTYTNDALSYGRVVGEVKLGSKSVNKEVKKFVKKM